MRIPIAFFVAILTILTWCANTGSSYAQPSSAEAWKLCQSSDADQRVAGCSLVISQGAGGSKARLADALDGRCWAHHVKGLYDLAVTDCRASISLRPSYSYAFNNLASAYLGLQKFDEALAAASKSIELKPKFLWSHLNRARAYAGLGQNERALNEYQVALSLDPNNAEAMEESRALSTRAAAANSQRLPQSATQAVPSPIAQPQVQAVIEPAKPGASLPTSRRIALVVGNSNYKNAPLLPNPERDAEMVADALKRTGFAQVTLQTNLGREALLGSLKSFSRAAQSADWAVVYFAGHGMEIGGINYLIPVDATLERDRDVEFEAVPLNQVLNVVANASSMRLVVLDACRINPFANRMKRQLATRAVERGFARIEPNPGTIVVYATKDGEVASDGNAGNSPFSLAFAKNIQIPGIEINKVFRLVRDDVLDATQNLQTPYTYGSLSGRQDFYFINPR